MGYMMFYVSWSPREGESTYTRCFPSATERDGFAAIKRDMPEVAARYTKTTTTRRFTFA
jgi:hypothetical protein